MHGPTIGVVLAALVALPGIARAEEPVRSQETEVAGVKTEVLALKRTSDNLIEVRWRWRNTTDAPVRLLNKANIGAALKKETYVVDEANKTKYPVVHDQRGHVVASPLPDGVYLKANQAVTAWAKFKAPPPGVDKVTVVIARTPPFDGVTLAKE